MQRQEGLIMYFMYTTFHLITIPQLATTHLYIFRYITMGTDTTFTTEHMGTTKTLQIMDQPIGQLL